MGAKITVDSATMMNKGLELIEAHHLFPVGAERARHPHPPAIGGPFDGRIPRRLDAGAARARRTCACRSPTRLAWPRRMETPCARLDLAAIGALTSRRPTRSASRRSAGARGARRGRRRARGAQRRQRGRGRRLPRRSASRSSISRHLVGEMLDRYDPPRARVASTTCSRSTARRARGPPTLTGKMPDA